MSHDSSLEGEIAAFPVGIFYESKKYIKGVNMTNLENLMSKKLITIGVDGTVSEAFNLMQVNRIRHLPVVDDKDGIVGIFSSRDFPSFGEIKDLSVEFFMNSPVIYIHKDTSLKQAVYKLLEKKISCLIISDDDDNALGIITTDDLLWYLVKQLGDDSDKRSIASKVLDSDTLGKVAYQISMTGI